MVQPVLALIAWSLVMLAWLYVQRLPTIFRYALSEARPQSGEVTRRVPPHVQWPADNYNNLLEQPMLFYALCLGVYATGSSTFSLEYFAWLYVALRVIHSLVHATCNIVVIRFGLFIAGSVVLGLMCVIATSHIFTA
ncbi:MAG: MAPEG family protein [Asticcacaulis sp.]|nr:MAPEG family protein [Asticcacaulis sp.]